MVLSLSEPQTQIGPLFVAYTQRLYSALDHFGSLRTKHFVRNNKNLPHKSLFLDVECCTERVNIALMHLMQHLLHTATLSTTTEALRSTFQNGSSFPFALVSVQLLV